MLESVTDIAITWAGSVPLPAFIGVGSFVEEVIAPIPSPVILAVSGSIAAAQGYGWLGVAWLLFVASLGKTIGSWVLYVIGSKGEHFLIGRFGRSFGLSHEEVVGFSHRFTGGWKDDVLLFGLRSIPVVPSAPVSVLCGVLRIPIHTFLVSTFLGCYVRCGLFFLLGYLGADAYRSMLGEVETIESILTVAAALAIGGFLAWCYWRRRA